MLNRAVLILRYKQPFVDWINAADPNPTHKITLADVNDDSTAYLIEVEDEKEFERWFKLNGAALFENELNGWYTDPELWPQDRTGALFSRSGARLSSTRWYTTQAASRCLTTKRKMAPRYGKPIHATCVTHSRDGQRWTAKAGRR